jgi:hypothetical protein
MISLSIFLSHRPFCSPDSCAEGGDQSGTPYLDVLETTSIRESEALDPFS